MIQMLTPLSRVNTDVFASLKHVDLLLKPPLTLASVIQVDFNVISLLCEDLSAKLKTLFTPKLKITARCRDDQT